MFCSYLLILCTVFHIKILFLTKNSRRTAASILTDKQSACYVIVVFKPYLLSSFPIAFTSAFKSPAVSGFVSSFINVAASPAVPASGAGL